MDTTGWNGLTQYVLAVAQRLGGDVEVVDVSFEETLASALIMTRSYVPTLFNCSLVLSWDEANGWALRVLMNEDGDTVALSYLGGDIDPLPHVVHQFVAEAKSGNHPGLIAPPAFRHPNEHDDLERRLADSCR